MKMIKNIWAGAALMTATLLTPTLLTSSVIAQDGAGNKPPATLVEVTEASKSMMAPAVFVPGTIVSVNDSRIAAQISGLVTWVAPEGTLVEAGDVVAKIDDADFALAAKRAAAQTKRLEARVKYLAAQLERYESLAKTNNTPVSRLEEAESNLLMTKQELEQARISHAQAKLAFDRTKVRAPFPGRVVSRLAQAGEYSAPGRQILRLVDVAHLEVKAQAPVNLASFIRDGQSVEIQMNQQRTNTNIRSIIPVGDEISRTMEVRVHVPAGQWVVGSAVQVALPSKAPEEVVSVHRDALVLRVDGTYIFRIKDDNTAERIRVTTGSAKGDRVAVNGGIEAGDRLVVRGGERLRPGQEVRLKRTMAENTGM